MIPHTSHITRSLAIAAIVAASGLSALVPRELAALPVTLVSNQWSRCTQRCRAVLSPISTSAGGASGFVRAARFGIGFVLHARRRRLRPLLTLLNRLIFRFLLCDGFGEKRTRPHRR